MDSSAGPSPSVSASELSSHVHKSVCVAGVVTDASNPARVRLEDHERAAVHVVRRADSPTVLENGMKVLVRGTVAPDLSISEAPGFPTTNLGEKFDLSLHYDAAKVQNQSTFSHIFS